MAIPADATNIVAIAAANEYSLLLRQDGTPCVYNLINPLPIPEGATSLVAIAAGAWHQLGLRSDGTVVGWGRNDVGQATPPKSVKPMLAIAAGDVFSLGLQFDGTVLAWGSNWHGVTNVPPDATNIVAIAAGAQHAVALRDDGRVFVWGDTSAGQGTVPAGLAFPSVIAAGGNHSLALVDVGELRFVREPISRTVLAGEHVALSAWAHGPGTMTYQWYRDGVLLPGATHAYLTLSNPQGEDPAVYAVVVSNSQGSITSRTATLAVTPRAPSFATHPVSHLVQPGATVVLTATAAGTEPVTYQGHALELEWTALSIPGPALCPIAVSWTPTFWSMPEIQAREQNRRRLRRSWRNYGVRAAGGSVRKCSMNTLWP